MSTAVPQGATNLVAICVEAILNCALDQPIYQWLKNAHKELGDQSHRQAVQDLQFLGLLDDSRRLHADVRAWRSDRKSLLAELTTRVRRAYVSAGCDENMARHIGKPDLDKKAIRKLLQDEPCFQELGNEGTRNNAIRLACHFHERIVDGTLVPQDNTQEDNAPQDNTHDDDVHREPSPGPAAPSNSLPPAAERPRMVNDLGEIVNPGRYRIARLWNDVWVYGVMHFENPAGASSPDLEEQARWMEQFAAALLQKADELRQQKTISTSQPFEKSRGRAVS